MTDPTWWKKAVFYQIYPRSFSDTTGNGIGDLNGISNNLEYLRDLGVEGIWISPFLCSPMVDFGYDVSDYRKVDPVFGHTEDIDRLIKKADNLGLAIVMDLVLNHTSDEHDWFMESASSRDNPKADWYVWVDPKPDGSPPNNWQSCFGGAAWEFNAKREQYYLHNWHKKQPDLNFHNASVRRKVLSVIKYWLEKGARGFRFDIANYYFHDAQLRDNPPNPTGLSDINHTGKKSPYTMQLHKYDISQPETLDFLSEIRELLDQYEGVFSVAEVGDDHSIKTAAEYTDGETKLHTAYTTWLLSSQMQEFNQQELKNVYAGIREVSKTAWPSWAFSNHDVIRVATRWTGKKLGDPQLCKLYMAILLSLQGCPFIYQGEELGLPEANIPYEKIQDPWGKYLWPEWQGRDGCRTPMPWSHDERNAGFSTADETWLPMPHSHIKRSVDLQEKDPNSMLNFTRDFIKWRKSEPALLEEKLEFLDAPENILMYRRGSLLCIFNVREKNITIDLDKEYEETGIDKSGYSIDGNKIKMNGYSFAFLKEA